MMRKVVAEIVRRVANSFSFRTVVYCGHAICHAFRSPRCCSVLSSCVFQRIVFISFRTVISWENGEPKISWEPKLAINEETA